MIPGAQEEAETDHSDGQDVLTGLDNDHTAHQQHTDHASVEPVELGRVKTWLLDTSTVYRVGMIRLGIGMLITGGCSVIVGGALMAVNKNHPWAGLGLWSGAPVFLNGLVCLAYSVQRPKEKVTLCSVSCCVGIVCSLFQFVTSVLNVVVLTIDSWRFYPDYTGHNNKAALHVLNVTLLVLAPLQGLLCCLALCLCIGFVCWCCRPARDRIYTISYDDSVTSNLEAGLHEADADFSADPFDDTEHILRIDADITDPVPLR